MEGLTALEMLTLIFSIASLIVGFYIILFSIVQSDRDGNYSVHALIGCLMLIKSILSIINILQ